MIQYFQNGKSSLNAVFLDDEPNGSFTGFYENGNKKKDGTLNKGTMVGNWKHYFENGKISLEENRLIAGGKLDGITKAYFDNGKQKYISAYKNGVENCADFKEWYNTGKIKMEG